MSGEPSADDAVPRRTFLKLGMAGGAIIALGTAGSAIVPDLRRRGLFSRDGIFDAASMAFANDIYDEEFPTSPLILYPFTDPLPVPKALRPVPSTEFLKWFPKPGPGPGHQTNAGDGLEQHQVWTKDIGLPNPLVYLINCQVSTHAFTTSKVLPINSLGQPTVSFDEHVNVYPAGTERDLPKSTIYSFNGTFPGPMINAEYGRPVLVRFVNRLDENPDGLDRQDFGSPNYSFLTHLHNAHTAPESDGNPHYSMVGNRFTGSHGPKSEGYLPKTDSGAATFVDNLYLNWPAGGLESEKQSFFWFHDHRMDHTGSNVYKGMVGLYPIYDPVNDSGSETAPGYHLPGVRTDNGDGSFDVQYDIPLAFYDCRLDDGVTNHLDIHDGLGQYPAAGNPRTHPAWWGKTFYKHFPNHGFVGDIFTVNGVANPVLNVERRKYRLRFLDASVSRIYEFKLMSTTQVPPVQSAASLGLTGSELQGQHRLPGGEQCMQFQEIATDGGLLPVPIPRDSFELWPAKRREFIVDFSKYMDGHPTSPGDVVYLTNVMKMPDGRMWTNSSRSLPDPNYKVPVLKFVIGGNPPVTDKSVVPTAMRDLPPVPANWKTLMANRTIFEVNRGSAGGEIEWLINGVPFDPTTVATGLLNPAGNRPLAQQKKGSFNLWEIRNGGGGWVHPFHLHMEEHRTLLRNGQPTTPNGTGPHPDDQSREDLVALDPGESVVIFRRFRNFVGPYVAHCHNLAHEDHAMMFGWEITP